MVAPLMRPRSPGSIAGGENVIEIPMSPNATALRCLNAGTNTLPGLTALESASTAPSSSPDQDTATPNDQNGIHRSA